MRWGKNMCLANRLLFQVLDLGFQLTDDPIRLTIRTAGYFTREDLQLELELLLHRNALAFDAHLEGVLHCLNLLSYFLAHVLNSFFELRIFGFELLEFGLKLEVSSTLALKFIHHIVDGHLLPLLHHS